MTTEFHSPRCSTRAQVLTYSARSGKHSLVINFDVMAAEKKTLHASASGAGLLGKE